MSGDRAADYIRSLGLTLLPGYKSSAWTIVRGQRIPVIAERNWPAGGSVSSRSPVADLSTTAAIALVSGLPYNIEGADVAVRAYELVDPDTRGAMIAYVGDGFASPFWRLLAWAAPQLWRSILNATAADVMARHFVMAAEPLPAWMTPQQRYTAVTRVAGLPQHIHLPASVSLSALYTDAAVIAMASGAPGAIQRFRMHDKIVVPTDSDSRDAILGFIRRCGACVGQESRCYTAWPFVLGESSGAAIQCILEKGSWMGIRIPGRPRVRAALALRSAGDGGYAITCCNTAKELAKDIKSLVGRAWPKGGAAETLARQLVRDQPGPALALFKQLPGASTSIIWDTTAIPPMVALIWCMDQPRERGTLPKIDKNIAVEIAKALGRANGVEATLQRGRMKLSRPTSVVI